MSRYLKLHLVHLVLTEHHVEHLCTPEHVSAVHEVWDQASHKFVSVQRDFGPDTRLEEVYAWLGFSKS